MLPDIKGGNRKDMIDYSHIHTMRRSTSEEKEKSTGKSLWQGSRLAVLTPYFLIAPAFAGFLVFLFYPFVHTIYLSFFLTNSVGEARVFRGVENYIRMFTSVDYLKVLENTFVFALIVIVGSLVSGFITANLSNTKGRAFSFFAILFTMPMAAATGSFSLVFKKMFDPTTGIVNKLLHFHVKWFLDPRIALFSMAFITIWMLSGTNFLYIHAGLRNIDKSILESAELDGAKGLTKLFFIVIPSISPILFFVLITDVAAAFQSFTQINIITAGGPGDATNVMVYSIYRDAFFNFRFGPAAAQSVVLFLIILAITLVQFKNEKRLVHYA